MTPPISLFDFPGLRKRDTLEPGFARELAAMAQSLGLDPNALAAVMQLESGFDPAARNDSSGATGLIQFLPSTAAGFGTSSPSLMRMSAIAQLEYVRKFYQPLAHAIRPGEVGDYYMATFMPAFVGAPAQTVLSTQGHPIYDQNRGLDIDHDGTLTVSDVTRTIEQVYAAAEARPRALFSSEKKKAVAAPSWPSSPSASSAPSSSPPCAGKDGAK
jgi:hypothetical protein